MPRALVALAVMAASAQALAAQRVTYVGNFTYAGGSYYFDARTDALYLSNGVRVSWGGVEFGGSIPLVTQNGGVVTRIAGGIPLPTGGADGSGVVAGRGRGTIGTSKGWGSGTGSGSGSGTADTTIVFDDTFTTQFGDPVFDGSVGLYSGFDALRSVRVNGFAKAPLVGLDSGVGSGAWDFGAGGSVVVAVGRLLLFVDGAYWWIGDLPDLELRDGVSYGGGASIPAFSGNGSLMLMLTGMSRTIPSADPPLSVALSVGRSAGEHGFLMAAAGIGLTESAPDLSVSLGWTLHD